ncbi:HepT-like ribonuclease domain-containing protein [Tepidimonas charontis]|nr:DUF86 domain-containing protein [Tepidimonas charontis]
MHERPPILYLQDILEAGEAIQCYVADIDFDTFRSERLRQSAVIREFEIIGEAAGKLPQSLTSQFPDIAWREIKDFRNLLIHAYFGVDLLIVWNTIHDELPALLNAVRALLGKNDSREGSQN